MLGFSKPGCAAASRAQGGGKVQSGFAVEPFEPFGLSPRHRIKSQLARFGPGSVGKIAGGGPPAGDLAAELQMNGVECGPSAAWGPRPGGPSAPIRVAANGLAEGHLGAGNEACQFQG